MQDHLQNHPSSRRNATLARITIVVLTLAVFWPLLGGEFTMWDDNQTLARNAHLIPPTLPGLAWYWQHPAGELYVPLTYTAWWLLAQLAYIPADAAAGIGPSLNPVIFHGANLALHLAASLIVFRIVRRLLRDDSALLAATAGALLFAQHPVQVETVAWLSGLKDLLGALLALVAIDQHLGALESESAKSARLHRAMSLIAFLTAMLAKPGTIALPIMIGVIDRYWLHRSTRDVIRTLAVYALLAIPCAIWSKIIQPSTQIPPVPLSWRPVVAGDALSFYLAKLIWPARLTIDYGRSPWALMKQALAIVSALVPVAIATVLWFTRSRVMSRQLATAALLFVAAMLPVLGLITFEFQFKSTVADHYLYLPMFGVALGISIVLQRFRRNALHAVAAIAIIALAVRSAYATAPWQNSSTLFTHAISINPDSAPIVNNLMLIELDQKNYFAAEKLAHRLCELAPDDPWSHLHLAATYAAQKRFDAAADVYRATIACWPTMPDAHAGLAAALIDMNRPDEALPEYDRAIELSPGRFEPLRDALKNRIAH